MKLQADDLLKMKVSLFKKCDDNRPFATITLDDYLHKLCPAAKKAVEEIREVNKTDPKSAKAMKLKNLPAVSISAVFDGVRNRDNILEDNPIFCIDIDEYKKRLRNVCKTYEDVFGLWIDEKSIDEDVLVKKFKEEFFAELMLLKMSNSINDLSYTKF